MVYRVIGVMSGSSLDGLDIVFAELHENAGRWGYEIIKAGCSSYPAAWLQRLQAAVSLNALEYQLLHADYGHYIGTEVNRFIADNNLHYKVALVASHGHTTFHLPSKKMTAQLGDGAAIAGETGLPVVTDLRSLDVALGGQGAPLVPIGEKLLWENYDYFLNIGGIANISSTSGPIGFDVCPANRVLNMLAAKEGKEYDEGGAMAAVGNVNKQLLAALNALDYYDKPYPKSLANDFGTDIVYPLITNIGIDTYDALRTYVEHIVVQIKNAVSGLGNGPSPASPGSRLLATGGGAFNTFLLQQLSGQLQSLGIDVIVPDENLVKYKEALIMALIGVLRWRQEYNVLSSVTGALRDSIGGALWNGQDA